MTKATLLPPIIQAVIVATGVIIVLRDLAQQKFERIGHKKGLDRQSIESQIKSPVGAFQFLIKDYSRHPD